MKISFPLLEFFHLDGFGVSGGGDSGNGTRVHLRGHGRSNSSISGSDVTGKGFDSVPDESFGHFLFTDELEGEHKDDGEDDGDLEVLGADIGDESEDDETESGVIEEVVNEEGELGAKEGGIEDGKNHNGTGDIFVFKEFV